MFSRAIYGRRGQQCSVTRHWSLRSIRKSSSGSVANSHPGQAGAILRTLTERGFVHQIAGSSDVLDNGNPQTTGVYVGVDPTARSLHVGHLVPFMALFWMHFHGFRTIMLVGGATAQIGDPTWRKTARTRMLHQERLSNVSKVEGQLKSLWTNVTALGEKNELKSHRNSPEILNNQKWLGAVSILEVLQDMGVGLRMGSLLSRDSVKTRLESDDGMALAEFCYPLLQAWDWWHMYQHEHVKVQIGGADQFGNIITGIEALKHILKRERGSIEEDDKLTAPLMGFTVPLLTTSTGEKFGKSAGNAVWLDPGLTTPFDLYAYMLSTTDDDVERLLKLFTFLPIEVISKVMNEQRTDQSLRVAQHRLAYEFLCLVHGPTVANETAQLHRSRANQRKSVNISQILPETNDESRASNQEVNIISSKEEVKSSFVSDLFKLSGLVETKAEAKRLILAQGAYIGVPSENDENVLEWHPVSKISNETRGAALQYVVWKGDQGILLLRSGKWKTSKITVKS